MVKIGERNSLEITARRFGFSNSDCKRDVRLARLVSFKARLDDEIGGLIDLDIRKLGKVAGLDESDYSDQRRYELLKSIAASRRTLATLRTSTKNAPTKTSTKND